MKILVLGGTQFVGRHIVEAMVEADHKVSILNRGRSHDPLPAGVERLRGDRDAGTAGLEALRGRTWDVCVDVSGYTPRQVRSSTEILAAAAGHYVYISAVSVYGDPAGGPVDEDVPLLAPAPDDVTEVNGETYGPLKVACERIALDTFADRCTVLRPQIVAGPHDPFDRFSYWVRASQDGVMLAPGDGSDFVQVIDARDVARFVRTVSEHRLPGSFNLAGDRVTWATFMAILGARRIEWVAADILAAAGLTFAELPLYRPVGGARSSLMNVGNERARRAGLRLTDLAETVRDVRRWLVGTAWSPALPPEREAALLSLARRGR